MVPSPWFMDRVEWKYETILDGTGMVGLCSGSGMVVFSEGFRVVEFGDGSSASNAGD